jgi:Flp pilus assembly protein TadG
MPGRGDDRGSAVVEFSTVGVLLLLPLLYLVVVLGRIEAASFAVDGAAREAARALVTAPREAVGRSRAQSAVALGLADQGFDASAGDVLAIECSQPDCLAPGSLVMATVELEVTLPGVPAVVDRVVPTRVTVRSQQVLSVDAFRSRRPRP